jgi:hypothetical protein
LFWGALYHRTVYVQVTANLKKCNYGYISNVIATLLCLWLPFDVVSTLCFNASPLCYVRPEDGQQTPEHVGQLASLPLLVGILFIYNISGFVT